MQINGSPLATRAENRCNGVVAGIKGIVFIHHVAHAHEFKEIDAVFAGDMLAAAREFLGENGTAQQQHRDAERRHAAA